MVQYAAHRTDGALAAAPATEVAVAETGTLDNANTDLSRAVQGTLFSSRCSNVIPFEAYASARVEPRQRPQAETPRKPATRRSVSRGTELQESLDFLPVASTAPRTLGTTVEAVISCESPVATGLHRAVAAGLDWAMVLIGYGLFLLGYLLSGGAFTLTKTTAIVFAGTLPLVALTYGLIWTIACTETPGMRWAQLRLTTFDGFRPVLKHRILRLAGSCLSLCTLIGLLWSLADEESLNWQDHISRTFPTPLASETQIFHRQ